MQKSFLVVVIAAFIGAFGIHQFAPAFSASIAFFAGAIIAALLFMFLSASSAKSQADYQGPMMTLYVGNLPYRVHEGEVKELFEQYGAVSTVRLVRDRKTGRRKGFGFVEMAESGAREALAKLNDFNFQERTIKVREAKTQDNGDSDNS
ncbi:RNA-binding protein [Shewanella corallii]|uniref:RNA-binding protein n=2 Tax=Shewanella TaxID=22 RepID=A0ABT0NCK4_9GAMM|nr:MULTISPECIES: RNA-binding protein [Shewanella]MCL1039599.1 RNA-binding protein [Shewanella submarina]MCL2916188.1 RNA-binding protein [Shewanella corallii]